MKPSIIVSTKDIAGMNIKSVLCELQGFHETTETFHGMPVLSKDGIKLYTTDEETINSEHIDDDVEGDWIIFATRHKAASGKKSFSVHAPGNWGEADLGGSPGKLCYAVPHVMKEAMKRIASAYDGDEFEVTMECTHHGPTLKKQCMFIEIGSSEEEWKRRDAGEIIAKVVNQLVTNPIKKAISVVVLGGGHYNQVATKLMLRTEYAVGHICPKHALAKLDEKMLKQAVEKNGEKFEMAVLDWKGMGGEKQRISEMLTKLGIKSEKYHQLDKDEPADSEE